jgi:hypothetical protein
MLFGSVWTDKEMVSYPLKAVIPFKKVVMKTFLQAFQVLLLSLQHISINKMIDAECSNEQRYPQCMLI